MKKLKVLFCLVLLMVVVNLNIKVKAAEQLPDDGAKISSAQIIQTKTGTGPWDEDDSPGNDSSEENDVVRSFDQVTWTIENTFALNSNDASSYQGGKLYFEVKLPSDKFNSETAKWDLSSMAWVENAQLSSDKMTLTGCYTLNPDAITIPGKQTVVFVASILGAPNGTEFQPEFKLWLNGNSDEEKYTVQSKNITISAAANYNIRFVRNTNENNRALGLDYNGTTYDGRIYGYVFTLQLYNTNTSKGLKGIEQPQGDITFDVDLKLERKAHQSSEIIDITELTTPLLWNYKINFGSAKISGRRMNFGAAGGNGRWFAPRGIRTSDRTVSVYDSGNINIVQEGGKLKVTMSNYKFDGVFPHYNNEKHANSTPAYGDNIGCFSVGYMQIFIPDTEDTTVDNSDYYLNTEVNNFNATSISGQNVTTQQVTTDDATRVQHVRYSPGSFSQDVQIYNASNGSILHSVYNLGDGSAAVGQEFNVRYHTRIGETNDIDDYLYAQDKLIKFDGVAFNVIEEPKMIDYGTMQFNIYYATKKDGTNWSSQTEMNNGKVEDLTLYNSLEDIPDGHVCVAIYSESIENTGHFGVDIAYYPYMNVKFRVTKNAMVGQTYGFVQFTKLWRTDLDRSIYSRTLLDSYDTYPVAAYTSGYPNYIKTEYDENGKQISGTHGGGYVYGNSLLVVGANQRVSITAVNATDNKKINYDIGRNEYNVRYKVSPKVTSVTTDSDPQTGVTIILTDTLPEGLTYVPGSSNYGEPEITNNSDGTTTLVWNINDCTIDVDINPLYFEAHIDENTINGAQYTTQVIISSEDPRLGNSKVDTRTATVTIQVINLASHRLFKTIETPVIEKNGEIHFTLSYKNNTDGTINDFRLLDVLPYNGDGRGSNFTGTYTLDKLIVKQYDAAGNLKLDNSNLTIAYTDDESVRGTITCKDENLGEDWTTITTENVLHSASAFVVMGPVESQEVVSVDIYLKTNGNKGLDKYENNATAQIYPDTEEMVTSNVTSQVVLRTIEGVAWYDINNNGIKDENEPVANNIDVTLTDENDLQVIDVNGQVVSSILTDTNGYYKFTDLPMSNYYVRVTMPDGTYMLTEKEVGANSTINSKFNVETNETDEITKLNSIDLPELTQSNVNAGFVKKPTKVVVNYLEKGTTTELLPEKTINGRIDDEYSTTNRIDEVNAANGNKYNYDSVEGDTSGFMIEDTIYITYYYVKKDTQVKVLHVEEGTDVSNPESVTDVLYATETLTGKVDDEYNTSNRLTEINNTHTHIK